MRASRLTTSALALLALAASCKDSTPLQPPALPGPNQIDNRNPQQADRTIPDPHPMDVGLGDETVTPVRDEPRVEPPSRSRRRMDLDQLSASLRRATGGLGWTETRNGTEVDLFVDLSATLGKPDFIQNTIEDLEPSALFLKFLDDAARSTCNRLLTREMASDQEDGQRTFFVHATPQDTVDHQPEHVEENLRGLLLRFHGRKVAAGAADVQPWMWLMQSTYHLRQDPVASWRAVCVGLINHPDFYTY